MSGRQPTKPREESGMSIDWRTTYNDLCNEIEILNIRAYEIKTEMDFVKRHMHTPPRAKLVASYSGMPNASGTLSFERLCGQYFALQTTLDDVNDILSLKREAQKRMELRMADFKGLEYQVVVMRDVQRKPLTEIADELGYSYNWIRKISSKVARTYKVNVKKGTIRAQIS